KFMSKAQEGATRGILRLENDEGSLDSWNVEYYNSGHLVDKTIKSLNVLPLSVSKPVWLQAQGSFVKGEYEHSYEIADRGLFSIVEEDGNGKLLVFEGEKIKGIYRLNTAVNEITYLGEVML